MRRNLFIVLLVCLLAGCGGGGQTSSSSSSSGSGSGSSGTGGSTTVVNTVPLVVDSGPASLNASGSSNITNLGYVSVTLCAPGSKTNCQTIDHIQVDTGSEGLRVISSVLNPGLLAALPIQKDASSRIIQECTQFLDGYVWGSVRQADLSMGGETASAIPIQTISDNVANVPAACASSGGVNEGTVSAFAANGILGIGPFPNDCGSACSQGYVSSAGYPYYACQGTGSTAACVPVAQGATASAPNQQVPNPISSFAQDNNGSLITLPSVSSTGQASATGSLIFGIGTQANNALGSAKVYSISGSTGYFTTVFNGRQMPQSYIDSGTSVLVFSDPALALCSNFVGYFCPASTTTLTAVNQGLNGASGSVSFIVSNAQALNFSNAVQPGLSASQDISGGNTASFAWGLPFFYGRSVFTAIQGAATPGGTGPFFAY
jgi:hypothetical protein